MTEEQFLNSYDITKYPQPSLTTDIILLSLKKDKPDAKSKGVGVKNLQILLVKRANHPFKGQWALPGGFCQPGETVLDSAKRELKEETNVTNAYLDLYGVYSEKDRDPRGWIISNAWLGLIDINACQIRADSDAWEARWFDVELTSEPAGDTETTRKYKHTITLYNSDINETLNATAEEKITLKNNVCESSFKIKSVNGLGFDHGNIITQTLVKFRERTEEDVRPIFNLLPSMFTIGELQAAYELVLGKPVDNFRRRMSNYVIETDTFDEIKGFRPAKLFIRNSEKFKYRT